MNKSSVEPITAAGGIVFRYKLKNSDPEILMIFRNGYWDLPKGKLEKGENIEMCAAREVSEEVGSGIPAIVKPIGTTYHEYPEQGKTFGKTTYWYSMIFTKEEQLVPQEKEGIKKVAWVAFPEAVQIAGFDNLKEILRTFGE